MRIKTDDRTLFGIIETIGDEKVFFYMTEVINDYSFSHEFGREEIKVRELDGYVNYDDGSYENPDLINEYFSKHHKELENKILNLYDNLQ